MNAPPLIERASIDEIRARAEVPVFNQLSGPKEYYRVQQLLRDRADLLSHYDELAKRPVPEPKPKPAPFNYPIPNEVVETVRATCAAVTDDPTEIWLTMRLLCEELQARREIDRGGEPSDEPSPLQIERDVYCLALSRLVRKLEAVHEDPRYKAVWESYMIHGGQYTEPKYTEELKGARELLSHYSSPLKSGGEQ